MTATALFETPNLDGLSVDPADYETAAKVFSRLATYAQCKGEAMKLRIAGNIQAAIDKENDADLQYICLPEWAKW